MSYLPFPAGLRAEEEEEQEVRLELEEREREARRAEEQLNSWQHTLGKQQLDVEGSEKGAFQVDISSFCTGQAISIHLPITWRSR